MRRLIVLLLTACLLFAGGTCQAQDVKQHARGAVELGWRYFNQGDTETALKRFNQALILDPNFAPAYFGIAYVYSVQSKFDLAIQNYRKSIEKDPTFTHSYSNLGLALLSSGRSKEALPMLQKALELDNKNGDAHVNMALYYFEAKEYSAAWKHVHLAQDNRAQVKPAFVRDLRNKMPEPKR
jgi:Tfp pilus assembly protein PilF